jgi:large subunit ribosomal protein L31
LRKYRPLRTYESEVVQSGFLNFLQFCKKVLVFQEEIPIFAFHFRKVIQMKKDIHPSDYRLVVFKDMSNEYSFICPSCAETKETISWEDGNEYPLVKLDISHKSHPFFTGIAQFVDTAGRIDKFKNRYGRHMK